MAGLPASGKSTIGRKLADHLNAVLLDKDEVRSFLFKDYVDYEREQDDLCVDVIYDVASYHLSKRPGTAVILDGRSYSRLYQVNAVKNAAKQAGVPLHIIECVCCADTARIRLETDQGHHLAKNRNYSMYEGARAAAQPIDEPRLTLHTDKNSEHECVELALSYIKTR